MRILVIEDDESSLRLAERIATGMGHQVLTAKSGATGLALVRSEKPDLLLLDLHLPDMDGFEITKSIKADASTKSLSIVIVSAGSALDRARAIATGCDEFVAKPYSPDDLRGAIRRRLPKG